MISIFYFSTCAFLHTDFLPAFSAHFLFCVSLSRTEHYRFCAFSDERQLSSLSISGQIMTLWFYSQYRQAAGSNPARDKNICIIIFFGRLR